MSLSSQIISGFESLSKQDEDSFDLCEASLLVAKVLQPSLKLPLCWEQIRTLCAQLNETFDQTPDQGSPLQTKVHALHQLMCVEMGFHGEQDAYDDLDHMNIGAMLDTKCGTALNLAILYVHCAKQCGWSAYGLNFPGYHLIAIEEGPARAVLDPFEQCSELDAYTLRQMIKVLGGAEAELQPAFYKPLSAKTMFIRHLGAIKLHFLRCEQMAQGLDILEICTTLEPTSPAFWRERGLLQARLGQIEEAVFSLKTALGFTNDAHARSHTQRIIDDLETKL